MPGCKWSLGEQFQSWKKKVPSYAGQLVSQKPVFNRNFYNSVTQLMLYYLDSSCQLDGNLTWYFPVDGKAFWRIFPWAAQQLSMSFPRYETQKSLLPLNALTCSRECEVPNSTLLNPHNPCIRAASDTGRKGNCQE